MATTCCFFKITCPSKSISPLSLKIFKRSEESLPESVSKEELYLLCGLMIEAAQTDGRIDKMELERISNTLTETFKEDKSEVE